VSFRASEQFLARQTRIAHTARAVSWIVASLVSAFFLGLYDLSKKHALRDNAVLPVLFLGTLCGAVVWAVLLLAGGLLPGALPPAIVPAPLSAAQHGLIFLKSIIVAASWTFTYFGIKHLPLSLASPIRATGPLWTLLGALLVLGERPSAMENAGIALTLVSFYGLSVAGRGEGVHFHRNKWVGCMIAGASFPRAGAPPASPASRSISSPENPDPARLGALQSMLPAR
jgi:bacterial/archaeal transporter family protein